MINSVVMKKVCPVADFFHFTNFTKVSKPVQTQSDRPHLIQKYSIHFKFKKK